MIVVNDLLLLDLGPSSVTDPEQVKAMHSLWQAQMAWTNLVEQSQSPNSPDENENEER